MNFKKVNAYMLAKLEEYKACYPSEIFEGLEVGVSGGSFGSCLITLKNSYMSLDCVYVGNYSAIDYKISDFIIRSYERLAERAYRREQEENKKGMYCKLTIYNNNKVVNELEYKTAQEVKDQLIKIIIAEKRRGVRTTWKPVPYSNNLKVVEKWTREEAHTTTDIKYVYDFKNIDY